VLASRTTRDGNPTSNIVSRSQIEALILLVLLTLVWGTNWPLFRIVLAEMSVWQFRVAVLLLGTAVLFAMMPFARGTLKVPPGRWPALVASSLCNVSIWYIATAIAVTYLPSGHAAVLSYTMPLWLALFSVLFLGERFTPRMLIAIAFGAGAVMLLMWPSFGAYAGAPVGLAAGLCAASAWAIGTLVVKRTDWAGMGLGITTWQMALSIPPMLIGAVLFDDQPWVWPPTEIALLTVYIAAIPIACGTAVWFAIVDRVPAQVAGLSSVSIPVVAVVAGVILFGEPMGPLQIAALLCTVISLWLALIPPRKAVKK
jgi:drug/metabolite transporter (DMT)-like permease